VDFKIAQKELYRPTLAPTIVSVPEMAFIMIDGAGDPNTSQDYIAAVETLYGLSYTIKMGNKDKLDYVVPPLEGFWTVADDTFRGDTDIIDKSKFSWTLCIRQPEFVTAEIFADAKTKLARKKPDLDLSLARLEWFTEGLCAQVMHIGAYDKELATIAALDRFIADSGYCADMSGSRRHHEIYLNDPRKTTPEKLKTVLRHPISKQ
jgi:hypothetical protein